jgi:HPt (histidine-containing phosphotransfer) domain-containing protein|tara:strand:+ start:7151 stop:7498 length:348 start_codon:yes stop_codon:yes gene_type:complete
MIDQEVFSELKAHMQNSFPMLLEIYLRDAEKYMNCIEHNMAAGDWGEIIIAAHSFRSASGSLGIIELSDKAGKIEFDSIAFKDKNDQNFEKIRADFNAMKNLFAAVEGDLRAELD